MSLTTPQGLAARSQTIRACEVHQQAAALDALDQDYEQLSRGSFSGLVASTTVAGVTLFVEELGAAVFQAGASCPGVLTIAAACDLSGEAYWNGRYIDGRAVIGFAAHRPFALRTPLASRCVGLSVPISRLENLLPGVSSEGWNRLLESKDCWTDGRDAGRRLADRMVLLHRLAGDPALADDGSFDQLLDDVLEEIWQGFDAQAFSGKKLREQSYPRIAMRARDAMLGRLCDPTDVEALARDLGCSRRALQYAFQSVFGMRPVEYLRTLRLSAVRQLLLHPTVSTTVGDAAAQYGLTHLPRFARDYCRMFCELPSQTLARASASRVCETPSGRSASLPGPSAA